MIRHLSVWMMISLFIGACGHIAAASDWRPLDAAILSQKSPIVEKDTDVEGIFWDVRVAHNLLHKVEVQNYIRLKVFTERGKEIAGKVVIACLPGVNVEGIEGRTIKPDGSVVEIKKDAIIEQTLASIRDIKVKANSFAFPAVEPGAILEYRWKEIQPFQMYSRYYIQRNIPIQTLSYHIEPPLKTDPNSLLAMLTATFNWPQIQVAKERDGSFGFQIQNVPAFREEPQMPPLDSVRPFLLVFYQYKTPDDPAIYWKNIGKTRYAGTTKIIKPNDVIKQTTVEVIGNSSQPEEVIGKILQFVRSSVKNVNDAASGLTPSQVQEGLRNKEFSDALRKGMGTTSDILKLFASMATAAGFDARMALTGNRADSFFNPSFTDLQFLNNTIIAIKVGKEWKFYDPAATYLPLGMLPWEAEGNSALIPDDTEPVFVTTPLSPPEKSCEKRTARLRLSEDGILEGDAAIEYTGHLGEYRKKYYADESPTQREEILRNMVKTRLGTAEISDIQVESSIDPEKPFTYRFHIRIPGYGQRTGKRLFFQPAFFQKGIGPRFTATQRKYNVYFSYPWSEVDDVEINLPAGYDLESPEVPRPIGAAAVANHEIEMRISSDHRVLHVRRIFFFGGDNRILFSVKEYPDVKRFFDGINEADNKMLTLKQPAAAQ